MADQVKYWGCYGVEEKVLSMVVDEKDELECVGLNTAQGHEIVAEGQKNARFALTLRQRER